MEKIWKETFLAHSKTSLFKKKVIEAKEIIRDALKRYKKPYIAFSGGKDSTCVLHLVLKFRPNILVYHFYFGKYFVPEDMERQVIENAKKIGANRLMVRTSKQYDVLKRDARNVLGRYYKKVMEPWFISHGYDCSFLGIRKQESAKRNRKVKYGFAMSKKIKEIYPIQDWSWLDVWAYIIGNNLPYLSFYDDYGKVVGYDQVRFTTFFDDEFAKVGSSNIDGILMWRFKNIKD